MKQEIFDAAEARKRTYKVDYNMLAHDMVKYCMAQIDQFAQRGFWSCALVVVPSLFVLQTPYLKWSQDIQIALYYVTKKPMFFTWMMVMVFLLCLMLMAHHRHGRGIKC